jgi:hypothetical protein
MTTTHRVSAALVAVALSACAHANSLSPSQPAESYAGGRAGQPQSWGQASTAGEQAPLQRWNDPSLGGRSAQPGSWISSNQATPGADPDYCYLGGRDAQPFSGPSLRVEKTSGSTDVCERASTNARL